MITASSVGSVHHHRGTNMRILWLVSGCLTALLAACGGPPPGNGNNSLSGGPGGGGTGAASGTGGASAGTGTDGGSATACQSDADCPAVDPGAPCHVCPNGGTSCPGSMCINGACQVGWPSCGGAGTGGAPGGGCKVAADCDPIPEPCQVCPDGTVNCPSIDCVNGQCVGSMASCQSGTGGSGGGSQCATAQDCPQMGMPCQLCPDGTTACPSVDCINGECVGNVQTCGSGGSGGSGGGGPQCSGDGDCVAPMLCQACADGSNACATATCVKGTCEVSFPACAGAGCKSDAECPSPMMPCKLCPDGTAACPGAACVNGGCQVSFPTCKGYDPCAGKACGDSCAVCDPNDPSCISAAVLTFCDASGQCGATKPACGGGSACPTGQHECACATGSYCVFMGAMCVSPSSPCPPGP